MSDVLQSPLRATLHTNMGDVRVELFPNHAPKTVRNFVELAEGSQEWTDPAGKKRTDPYFDGLAFHRVIEGFMIQGGCPRGDGRGGPGYEFDDEIHPELTFNKPYLLAMANAGQRRDPLTGRAKGTNGSQFFITVSTPTYLNRKHTIFGEVADAESRAVVDQIASMRTDGADRPVKPVVIERLTIERARLERE